MGSRGMERKESNGKGSDGCEKATKNRKVIIYKRTFKLIFACCVVCKFLMKYSRTALCFGKYKQTAYCIAFYRLEH